MGKRSEGASAMPQRHAPKTFCQCGAFAAPLPLAHMSVPTSAESVHYCRVAGILQNFVLRQMPAVAQRIALEKVKGRAVGSTVSMNSLLSACSFKIRPTLVNLRPIFQGQTIWVKQRTRPLPPLCTPYYFLRLTKLFKFAGVIILPVSSS